MENRRTPETERFPFDIKEILRLKYGKELTARILTEVDKMIYKYLKFKERKK